MERDLCIDQDLEVTNALQLLKLTKPRNYGTGTYLSDKAVPYHQPIEYANPMELIFMYWMDHTEHILQYRYENLEIPYKYEKRTRLYHPDFDVLFRDFSKAIWELKQNSTTGGNKTRAKKLAAEEYARTHGYKEYKIFTLPEVRSLF